MQGRIHNTVKVVEQSDIFHSTQFSQDSLKRLFEVYEPLMLMLQRTNKLFFVEESTQESNWSVSRSPYSITYQLHLTLNILDCPS